NQTGGLINRPSFWDTIAQKVQVYREDIQELQKGTIRLKNGEDVRSDAILCGTGWIPSLGFFDQELLAELGIPQPLDKYPKVQAEMWEDLEKTADGEVLDRFPILANPPEHYRKPVTYTPYRLYKSIAPLRDDSIAFVGHVLIANYCRVAECQAIWATAYLDGKIRLPPLEQRRKDVALFIAWCRRRYLSNGDRGHWMSADQTGYTDDLFHQLGLSSHRKYWLWDAFVPSTKKDLHRVRAEYINKFGKDSDVLSIEGQEVNGNKHGGNVHVGRDLSDRFAKTQHSQTQGSIRSMPTGSDISTHSLSSASRLHSSSTRGAQSTQTWFSLRRLFGKIRR
ncbi:MAG: hypothetical protein Q9224_006355, partial [Gallowayella concinna]